MPNIKSAKKRVKVSDVKTLQNKMTKSALRTAMKKYESAVSAGDKANAEKAYAVAVKKLATAAAKGIIHRNNAARKKSQYALALNRMA